MPAALIQRRCQSLAQRDERRDRHAMRLPHHAIANRAFHVDFGGWCLRSLSPWLGQRLARALDREPLHMQQMMDAFGQRDVLGAVIAAAA